MPRPSTFQNNEQVTRDRNGGACSAALESTRPLQGLKCCSAATHRRESEHDRRGCGRPALRALQRQSSSRCTGFSCPAVKVRGFPSLWILCKLKNHSPSILTNSSYHEPNSIHSTLSRFALLLN